MVALSDAPAAVKLRCAGAARSGHLDVFGLVLCDQQTSDGSKQAVSGWDFCAHHDLRPRAQFERLHITSKGGARALTTSLWPVSPVQTWS